jgi:hypothetical protein
MMNSAPLTLDKSCIQHDPVAEQDTSSDASTPWENPSTPEAFPIIVQNTFISVDFGESKECYVPRRRCSSLPPMGTKAHDICDSDASTDVCTDGDELATFSDSGQTTDGEQQDTPRYSHDNGFGAANVPKQQMCPPAQSLCVPFPCFLPMYAQMYAYCVPVWEVNSAFMVPSGEQSSMLERSGPCVANDRFDANTSVERPLKTRQNDGSAYVSHDLEGVDSEWNAGLDAKYTTVCFKNIPNNYTRSAFCDLLNENGFAGRYDFIYLPIDWQRNSNRGYAFVNLISTEEAHSFRDVFDQFRGWSFTRDSRKVGKVRWGEHAQQGLQAQIKHYRNRPVMREKDEHRPIILENGQRVRFPHPTQRNTQGQ